MNGQNHSLSDSKKKAKEYSGSDPRHCTKYTRTVPHKAETFNKYHLEYHRAFYGAKKFGI